MLPGKFPHQFENKDTIFWLKGVSDLSYELCYFLNIEVIQILTKPGNLVQCHCDFFVFLKDGALSSTEIFVFVVFLVWDGYRIILNNISRFIVYRRFCNIICLHK